MNIDYNLYKIFLYLYEEKSISKTASKLYVSQPAISYSLKELESQLGYPLFTRNSKGIEPTLEARELYGYISTAFNILNDAEEHLKNLNDLNIGSIRIGISKELSGVYLNNFLVYFKDNYPNINISIIVDDLDKIMDMLEVRQIDLALGKYDGVLKKDISEEKVEVLQTCIIYDDNHKIEKLEDIDDLIIQKKSFICDRLDDCLKLLGLNITYSIEVDDYLSLVEFVKRGIGVGFVVYQNYLDSNIHVLFDDRLPKYEVSCFYNNDYLTMASRKLLDCIKNRS
ncbi:MAG: LysR family transcriptional regulator [Bacilli bacterium]|nr:LysR family transcriptional regulator [Bacilli bacterium]